MIQTTIFEMSLIVLGEVGRISIFKVSLGCFSRSGHYCIKNLFLIRFCFLQQLAEIEVQTSFHLMTFSAFSQRPSKFSETKLKTISIKNLF